MAVPSIFRVDDDMRSKRREAFEPQKIALGPYHTSWPPVNQLKEQVFRKLVDRSRWNSDSFNNAVQGKEAEASKYYRWDGPPLPSAAFRNMLLYDGCFMLEIISGKMLSFFVPYLEHQKMLVDVLKLENQIPMVVLRELHRLEHGHDRVEELLLNFMFTPANYTGALDDLLQKMHDASHVLEAMRIKMFAGMVVTRKAEPGELSLQKNASCTNPGFAFRILHSATELLDAGILLSPNSSGAVDWVEEASTLSLPPITVTTGMDVLFLNMVAFERGTGDWRQPATSCFRLFKDLVRTADDVRALRSKGILINALPTDDGGVVDFFRELTLGDGYDVDMLCGTRMAVNAKVGSRKVARWARIRHASPKMPSSSESLAVAAGLVLLLQTVHLIRLYTKSPENN